MWGHTMSVVDAACIVEYGEELDDFDLGIGGFCQSQAVLQDPRPMAYAVGAVRRQGIVFKDSVDEGFEVHLRASLHRTKGGEAGVLVKNIDVGKADFSQKV